MSRCTIKVDPTIKDRAELKDEDGANEIILDICASNDKARGKDKTAALEYVAGVIVTRGKRRRLEPIAHALRDKITTSAQSAAYWRPLTSIRSADKSIAAAKLAMALSAFGACGFTLGKIASDLVKEGEAKLEGLANEAREKREEAKAKEVAKKAKAEAVEKARANETPEEAAKRAEALATITAAIRAARSAGATADEIRAAVEKATRAE